MIRGIGVTRGDDTQIGYYVGLVNSLFWIAQACTIFHWNRASDHIGRRPILFIGMTGLSMSMYAIGLSRKFWVLALSRCLSGALNGNIGIIKSMVAEITDLTNHARACSLITMTWFLGNTIGPLVGGLLERPAEKFPAMFGSSTFLKEYPYFFPCSIIAAYVVMCWVIVTFFLNETNKVQMSPTQYLLGRWCKSQAPCEGSPAVADDSAVVDGHESPVSFRELLVAPVLLAAGSLASFSILDISFRTLLPVFLATPIEMGGLGLDPPLIGVILATIGISGGAFQLLFFSPLHNRLGGKILFIAAVSLFFPVAALFPITNRVGREQGLNNVVWLLVSLQILLFVCASFALSVTFVCVNSAAPNRASIGATNGLAQLMVAVVRAIGPLAVNSAFTLGIQKHIMQGTFAYWLMAGMTIISLAIGSAMTTTRSKV